MSQPIYVIGYPGPIGGACTELWHVLKLWRRNGLEVHLVNPWGKPADEWERRCSAIGCITHQANPNREELAALPGLAGSTVVSFCNEWFLQSAELFRRLKCRIVWVGCMNWLFAQERRLYAVLGPFDAYVCQSRYQIDTLGPELAKFGVKAEQIFHIPGWIDVDEFTFRPREHAPGEPFVIGRVSRAAPSKFSTNTWPILDRVNYRPIKARILGWADAVQKTIGTPPDFAEVLPMNAEPVERFMGSLHCYSQINGTDQENWPRSGLEAMASGVPICVERRGGWPAMIENEKTGYVCDSDRELAHRIACLAYDEDLRQSIAAAAYRRLVSVLAEPEDIFERWARLFESVRGSGIKKTRKRKEIAA